MFKFILLNYLYVFFQKILFCFKVTLTVLGTAKQLPEQRFLVLMMKISQGICQELDIFTKQHFVLL